MAETQFDGQKDSSKITKNSQKKRKLARWAKTYVPLISLGIAFLALLATAYNVNLAIQNTKRSKDFGQFITKQIGHLDSLFLRVADRIETLPKSVEKFDSTIQEMNAIVKEQQKELASSIGGLRGDVDLFSKSLISYDTTLKGIISASNKNLELLQKSNARWEAEISRVPKLELVVEKVKKISNDTLQVFLRITNSGNQIAENCRMVLEVPVHFELIATGWKGADRDERGVVSWSYPAEPIDIIYYYDKPGMIYSMSRLLMNFKLKIPSQNEFPLSIHYIIYHKRGFDEDELLIQP